MGLGDIVTSLAERVDIDRRGFFSTLAAGLVYGCTKKPEPQEHQIDPLALKIYASIEGNKSIRSDTITSGDVLNIQLVLDGLTQYKGNDLTVEYFMRNRDHVDEDGKLIELGSRSDFHVDQKGTAKLEGIFEFSPDLTESYERGSPAINPFNNHDYDSNKFDFLVRVKNRKGELVTQKWWGQTSENSTPLELRFADDDAPATPRSRVSSERKKVFIYEQRLGGSREAEAFSTVDFFQPHLYDMKGVVRSKGRGRKKKSWREVTLKSLAGRKYRRNIKQKAREHGFKVTPMLSSFYARDIKEMLANPRTYSKRIADKIKADGWDGVAIDFESTRLKHAESAKLTAFMRQLRRHLPENQYTISIAVSPRWQGSDRNGFSHHGFYNLRALAPHVNYVQVMAYDFHNKRRGFGPLLPQNKIEPIVNYAKRHVGSDKTVFLLPMYGYVWNRKTRRGLGSVSARTSEKQAARRDVQKRYDRGELRIETPDRVGYHQDERVWQNRLNLIEKLGINNIGGWRGSHATRKIYDTIANWKRR